MKARRVALISDDLMFDSRLRAALTPSGIALTTSPGGAVAGAEMVFVDLNRQAEDRLQLIARLRQSDPGAIIVGFCHHGDKLLRSGAMARGATQVVTNGAVPEVALRLAGIGPAAGA